MKTKTEHKFLGGGGDKISVIMPAYNVEKYIGKSIESVLRQTHQNLELVIVNDGSKDNTRDVVQAYMARDTRITYIEQPNKGVSAARNTGMKAATGEYIAFLDADDLYLDDCLEKLYKAIQERGGRAIYGRTQEFFLDGTKTLVGDDNPAEGYMEDFAYKGVEFRSNSHISGWMIEKKAIVDHNLYFPENIRLDEDTTFFILVTAAVPALCLNEVVSYYCHRENSAIVNSANNFTLRDHYSLEGYQFLKPQVEKLRPSCARFISNRRNYSFYRFILKCIKNEHIEDAQNLIKENTDCLEGFLQGPGRPNDKLKCRLIVLLRSSKTALRLLCKM